MKKIRRDTILPIVTLVAFAGIVVYSLVNWSSSTDFSDRFEWIIVAGVGGFGAVYSVIILRRALAGTAS